MTDLIERQAVIDCIDRMKDHAENHQQRLGIMAVGLNVCALPSAEPERKKGKWENYIADTGVEHWRVIRCSECEKVAIERYNYCPHCGAYMREEE